MAAALLPCSWYMANEGTTSSSLGSNLRSMPVLTGLRKGDFLGLLTGELLLLYFTLDTCSSIDTDPRCLFSRSLEGFLLSFEEIDSCLNFIFANTEKLSIGLFPSNSFFCTVCEATRCKCSCSFSIWLSKMLVALRCTLRLCKFIPCSDLPIILSKLMSL